MNKYILGKGFFNYCFNFFFLYVKNSFLKEKKIVLECY